MAVAYKRYGVWKRQESEAAKAKSAFIIIADYSTLIQNLLVTLFSFKAPKTYIFLSLTFSRMTIQFGAFPRVCQVIREYI